MATVTATPKAPSVDGEAAASISAFGKARSTVSGNPLNADDVKKIDAFWRASEDYLALGMTYLKANPLLATRSHLSRSTSRTGYSDTGEPARASRSATST